MKTIFSTSLLVLGAACLVSPVAARAVNIYSTNFDEFDKGLRLSQQSPWATDDTYKPASAAGQSDAVNVVTSYSATSTDYLAILGGLTNRKPGKLSINLWANFNTAGILANTPTANDLQFTSTASVSNSVTPAPNHDSFGWSFRNSSGVAVFGLALDYDTATNLMRLSFINGAGVATQLPQSISLDSNYTYLFDAKLDSATRDALDFRIRDGAGNLTTILNNQTLPDGVVSTISQIAAVWTIKNPAVDANGNPTAYGNNSMLISNYTVAVVPEPTTALCLLGGMAVLGLRRRR